MKYIMFQTEDGQHMPVMFPDRLVHADVARSLERAFVLGEMRGVKPVSAGFCDVEAVAMHGTSESLSLESRGERDKNIVNQYKFLYGIESESHR
jgi:hypothetical protein